MQFESEQEIYDYVGEFLYKQGVQSKNEEENTCLYKNTCLYRGPNGRKCAAGCLIDDEYYISKSEGKIITSYIYDNAHIKFPDYLIKYKDFIRRLQIFHDDYLNWEDGFNLKNYIIYAIQLNKFFDLELNTEKLQKLLDETK